MSQKKIILSLTLVVTFLAGCLVGQAIIPPVRAGTSPQRWEYMWTHPSEVNQAGAKGWELVAVDQTRTCYFKRLLF
jgi:hypothetical protein